MIHVLENEWMINGVGGLINTRKLWSYIKYKQLQPVDIPLVNISYKSLENIDINCNRYIIADPSYPLLVVKGMNNPHNKPYRMIDGRHRLLKHQLTNNNNVPCHVLMLNEVLPYVTFQV